MNRIRNPDVHGARRDIEHSASRADDGCRLAIKISAGQIADGYGVQSGAVKRFQGKYRTVHLCGGNDAVKLVLTGALMPPANGGKTLKGIASAWVQIQRRIKDQLAPDQPAGIVSRRIIVIGAKLVGGAVREPSFVVDAKQAHFGSAPLVAVSDHNDGIARDQHLVVPSRAGINVGS